MKYAIFLTTLFISVTLFGQVEGWVGKDFKVKWSSPITSTQNEKPDYTVKTREGDVILVYRDANKILKTKGDKILINSITSSGKFGTAVYDIGDLEGAVVLEGAYLFANKVFLFVSSRNRKTEDTKLFAIEYIVKSNSFSPNRKLITEGKHLSINFGEVYSSRFYSSKFNENKNNTTGIFGVYTAILDKKENEISAKEVIYDSLFKDFHTVSDFIYEKEEGSYYIKAGVRFFLEDGSSAKIEGRIYNDDNNYKPKELKTYFGICSKSKPMRSANIKIAESNLINTGVYFFPDKSGWVTEVNTFSKNFNQKYSSFDYSAGFTLTRVNVLNKQVIESKEIELSKDLQNQFIKNNVYEDYFKGGNIEINGLTPVFFKTTKEGDFILCFEERVDESTEKFTKCRNGSIYVYRLSNDLKVKTVTKVPKFQIWFNGAQDKTGAQFHYFNDKLYILYIEMTENYDENSDKKWIRYTSNDDKYSLVLTEIDKEGNSKNNILYNCPTKKGYGVNPNCCIFVNNKLSLLFSSDNEQVSGWLELK